jgi:hypothetical protein
MAELSLKDEQELANATSERTTYDVRGGQSWDRGDPEAHERASERVRILGRRVADLDATIRALEEQIERRTAEIGL